MSSSSVDTTTPYAVNAVLTVKPDRRKEFIKVIKQDQAQTLATEAGAVRFVVGQDVENANTFYLHEQYINKQAYEQHTKTPHFAPFDAFSQSQPWADEPIGGAPRALFYHVDDSNAVQTRNNNNTNKQPSSPSITSSPPPVGHYCLHASLTLLPERRQEFVDIFRSDQEKTLTDEPDSVHFVFGAAAADSSNDNDNNTASNTFVVFEQYKNKAAFEQHNQMPHYKPWADFCQTNPWAEGGEPKVAFYNTI